MGTQGQVSCCASKSPLVMEVSITNVIVPTADVCQSRDKTPYSWGLGEEQQDLISSLNPQHKEQQLWQRPGSTEDLSPSSSVTRGFQVHLQNVGASLMASLGRKPSWSPSLKECSWMSPCCPLSFSPSCVLKGTTNST